MRMSYVLVVCVLLPCLRLGIPAQESGTNVARTVRFDAVPAGAPFKFVKVLHSGVEVEAGVPFQASNDWFNGLQVVIRNVSRKNLVFAMGQLRFPETGDERAENLAVMDRILVGRRPEHARYSAVAGLSSRDPSSAPILVRPDEEVAIPAIDPLDRIQSAMEAKRPLFSVTICEVGIHTLYFDDGTSWISGMYFRADPRTPGRYVRISQEDFENMNRERRK